LRSRSRVFRGTFWHVLVLLAAIKTVLASVGDAAEGPSGPDPSDLYKINFYYKSPRCRWDTAATSRLKHCTCAAL
jgi:hypothetical protein